MLLDTSGTGLKKIFVTIYDSIPFTGILLYDKTNDATSCVVHDGTTYLRSTPFGPKERWIRIESNTMPNFALLKIKNEGTEKSKWDIFISFPVLEDRINTEGKSKEQKIVLKKTIFHWNGEETKSEQTKTRTEIIEMLCILFPEISTIIKNTIHEQ
jgi:hypothetical protein